MTLGRALFASDRMDWETPQSLFDELDAEFHFALDVCATDANHKAPAWYTPKVDGLKKRWRGVCWMNPPYGREIGKWMRKAYAESRDGATVVCLVPARTDTAWWHDYAIKGEVRFLRGRLRFVGAKNCAPFPSAIVIFRGGGKRRTRRTRTRRRQVERPVLSERN